MAYDGTNYDLTIWGNRAAAVITRRAETANPRLASCKLHLRRICGTCAHYQGPLWPDRQHPPGPARASCTALQITTGRTTSAQDCKSWIRPSKGRVADGA